MSRWRGSRLVRLLTILLLLRTGADLADVNLCALEREDSAVLSAALSPDSASALSNNGASTPTATHVDDCFCCSHCVELECVAAPLGSMPISSDIPTLTIRISSVCGSPLYHPPLS